MYAASRNLAKNQSSVNMDSSDVPKSPQENIQSSEIKVKSVEKTVIPKQRSNMNPNGNPYVPGYQYDIFVSYASVDNQDGWVTTLIDWLQERLTQKLGPNALWMDNEPRDDTSITSDITKRLEKSAILLLILSKGYLESQWCRSEFDMFLVKADKDIGRVFIVKCDDIQNPEKLSDLNGYRFWERDKNKNPRVIDSKSEKYVTKVNTLCDQLKETLEELKEPTKLFQEQQAKSKKAFEHIKAFCNKAFAYKNKGDPEAFLWMARKTAEAVCCKIFVQKIGQYPKKQGFDTCINRLNREKLIPSVYIRYLKNIQEAGNEAVHYQCEDEYTQMVTENLPDCDIALQRLTDWYFNECFSQTINSPTVFLAKVTGDLEEQRDRLKCYLEQYKVKVLPNKDNPISEAQFQHFLNQDFEKSCLFIQLLSDNYGYQDFRYPQIQYEHAKSVQLPILQWRDGALNLNEVPDIAHRKLLETNTVIATTGFVEFQEIVNNELKKIQSIKINGE